MSALVSFAALLLSACAERMELQSRDTLHATSSDVQLTERVTGLAKNLQADLDTGQNGEGFYANFSLGSCHYAVQRFKDGRLQVDAYWYSERSRARCDQSPALAQFKAVLG